MPAKSAAGRPLAGQATLAIDTDGAPRGTAQVEEPSLRKVGVANARAKKGWGVVLEAVVAMVEGAPPLVEAGVPAAASGGARPVSG